MEKNVAGGAFGWDHQSRRAPVHRSDVQWASTTVRTRWRWIDCSTARDRPGRQFVESGRSHGGCSEWHVRGQLQSRGTLQIGGWAVFRRYGFRLRTGWQIDRGDVGRWAGTGGGGNKPGNGEETAEGISLLRQWGNPSDLRLNLQWMSFSIGSHAIPVNDETTRAHALIFHFSTVLVQVRMMHSRPVNSHPASLVRTATGVACTFIPVQ